MHDSLIGLGDAAAMGYVAPDGVAAEQRLSVYRNTFDSTLENALRLSYPAVRSIVGQEFFEGAATIFAHERPPSASWLDVYGADFGDFLAAFAPAASLPYLPDVARLEWAVTRALHAPDAEPIDANRLATVDSGSHDRMRFIVDPSVSLLRTDYPADSIWRAVLGGDDAALAEVDLADGPVSLLVQRTGAGVEVVRIDATTFRITSALMEGKTLGEALACAEASCAAAVLTDHLAARRFVAFEVLPLLPQAPSSEIAA